jgi:choline dehydrogenase
LEWLLFKSGAGATNQFEAAGYICTRPDLTQPNIQLCFIPMLVHYDGSTASTRHGFQVTVMQLQPRSRGRLSLAAADPRAAPLLRFNYLRDPSDIADLRQGLRALRDIIAQPAMAACRGAELAPGDGAKSDADLDDYIRRTGKSTHHPACTCRMGSDEGAVVDTQGRVRGVRGLRVIDASIMPSIPSGNINAPTIMIAEKLADAVRGRPAAAPAFQDCGGTR